MTYRLKSSLPHFRSPRDLSSAVAITQLTLDADGDGTPDIQGTSLEGFTYTYTQPGVNSPQIIVTDASRQTYTATAVVHVSGSVAMDARLHAVWSGVKDALRGGDVTSAAAFIHSDTRAQYQSMWSQLPAETLVNVDQIMQAIRLIEVGPASAICEMRRETDGQTFSFAVSFQLDLDGLWRLYQF